MEIGPVPGDQPTPSRAGTDRERPEPKPNAEPAGDRLEISVEARKRLAAAADRALKELSRPPGHSDSESKVTAGQTDPASEGQANDAAREAKLARVRGRIESGFYDRSDVKETIAERLAEGLNEPLRKDE